MAWLSGPDLNGLRRVRIFPALVDNAIIFHEQKVDYDLSSYDCIKSHKFCIDMIICMHRFLLSKPNHDSKTLHTPVIGIRYSQSLRADPFSSA